MMRLTLTITSLACVVLLSSCQPRRDAAATAQMPEPIGEQAALQARMGELDRKIAALEGRLSSTSKATGTGAYAQGTTLRVEGDGRESVLERLRRLETELAGAQATITANWPRSAVRATTHSATAARSANKSTRSRAAATICSLRNRRWPNAKNASMS